MYDNRKLTRALYLYWKDIEKGFTFKSAYLLFNFEGTVVEGEGVTEEDMQDVAAGAPRDSAPTLHNPQLKKIISRQELERCFLFSQMTIINEVLNYEKYDYLRFIEFLEMICRVALKLEPTETAYAPKVYEILRLLLAKMASLNIDPFNDMQVEIVRREQFNKNDKLELQKKDKDKQDLSDSD